VLQMQVCYSVMLYSVQTSPSLNVTRRVNSNCSWVSVLFVRYRCIWYTFTNPCIFPFK